MYKKNKVDLLLLSIEALRKYSSTKFIIMSWNSKNPDDLNIVRGPRIQTKKHRRTSWVQPNTTINWFQLPLVTRPTNRGLSARGGEDGPGARASGTFHRER
jgi:hypothetical protein